MDKEVAEVTRSFEGGKGWMGEDVGGGGVRLEAPEGSEDFVLEGKGGGVVGEREREAGSGRAWAGCEGCGPVYGASPGEGRVDQGRRVATQGEVMSHGFGLSGKIMVVTTQSA